MCELRTQNENIVVCFVVCYHFPCSNLSSGNFPQQNLKRNNIYIESTTTQIPFIITHIGRDNAFLFVLFIVWVCCVYV